MLKQIESVSTMMNQVKEYTSLVDREHSLCKTIMNLEHSLTELEGNAPLVEVASIKSTIMNLRRKLSQVQSSLQVLEQAI